MSSLHHPLYAACSRGDLESATRALESGRDTVNHDTALCCALANGHVHVAEWLVRTLGVGAFGWGGGGDWDHCYREPISRACAIGREDVVKWMAERLNVGGDLLGSAFLCACGHGRLGIAKYLVQLGVDPHRLGNHGFFLACSAGHVETAKGLLELGGLDYVYHDGLNLLEKSCEYGQLEIIKWLAKRLVIRHDKLHRIFESACEHGRLEVAQWLVETHGDLDIHAFDDRAFRLSCSCGRTHIAKWLVGLGGVDVHICLDDAFRAACKYAHLDTAKWLHGLGGVDIHAAHDSAFCIACEDGRLDIGRWLINLDPDDGAWPAAHVACLHVWSPLRDLWIRAALAAGTKHCVPYVPFKVHES